MEYVDISRLANEAMPVLSACKAVEGDKIGQIPKGRQNGFDLRRKCPWQQNHCSRRSFPSDIFAILTPRARI